MRLALFLGLCLASAFVADSSFVEDESVLEDAEQNDARHHLRGCEKDKDCGAGECCRKHWYWFWYKRSCFRKRKENERCLDKTSIYNCHFACADGLECRRGGKPRHPHHHHHAKCVRAARPPPTEEPGSGDMDF